MKHLMIWLSISCSVVGCGEAAPKSNNANNLNNVNNQNNNPDLLAWCSQNVQEAICDRPADNFSISINIEEGCGQFANPECDLTPQILQGCLDVILECPQDEDLQTAFTACVEVVDCIFLDLNNENNTNNTNNTNNANNQTPSPDFLAVAELWTENCALLACHGAASNNVISASANQNATPAEVYEALRTTTPTASGLQAIEPFNPDESEVIIRMSLEPIGDLREMPQGTGSPQEHIDVFTTWINNGAGF